MSECPTTSLEIWLMCRIRKLLDQFEECKRIQKEMELKRRSTCMHCNTDHVALAEIEADYAAVVTELKELKQSVKHLISRGDIYTFLEGNGGSKSKQAALVIMNVLEEK